MFGRNDFVENVKSALAAVDCDMGAFRSWQKQYDRLKKKQKEQKERYERCREQTKRVQEDAQLMEQMLIAEQTADRKEFGRLLKDLRQMQNNFDHEFLVSKEDQEFHSTYDTILRLGMKALNAPDQKLLLQSEIENLLALVKENLEKEKPKIEALTFYYQFENMRFPDLFSCINDFHTQNLRSFLHLPVQLFAFHRLVIFIQQV